MANQSNARASEQVCAFTQQNFKSESDLVHSFLGESVRELFSAGIPDQEREPTDDDQQRNDQQRKSYAQRQRMALNKIARLPFFLPPLLLHLTPFVTHFFDGCGISRFGIE